MSDTQSDPTPGKWYTHKDGDSALCVSSDRGTDGADKFVAFIKRADNESYEDAVDNARLIAAAGTAAHELPSEYDPVAAVEALPDFIDAANIPSKGDPAHANLRDMARTFPNQGDAREFLLDLADALEDALDAARTDD